MQHEAEHHRKFVKRLHMLIHSEKPEDERALEATAAVLSYAAALEEVAEIGNEPLKEDAYVDMHLTKASNWIMAWQSLSDPLDPATARVCNAARQALRDEMRERHNPRQAA